MKRKKSDDYYVELPEGISTDEMHGVLEKAAETVGMYISHVGGYSRKKYPNSVHWHFKRDRKEPGLLDATFWDVKNLFWLMIRHREPQWVHEIVPTFLTAIKKEIQAL
ncbi:hypothetical protein SPB21_08930 [Leptothoe sp. ISB3NOV94-8A]|nr:hypothetical protein [Leptothoe sp. LEGE 181152]